MEKKVYFQKSVILYCVSFIILLIIGCGIGVVIWAFLNESLEYALSTLLTLPFTGFMLYSFIKIARNRIILYQTVVFVPQHWGNENHIIQFETEITYAEIEHISLMMSTKNSLDKKIINVRGAYPPMLYIVFECKGEDRKRINMFHFSQKQVIRIIDEIIYRAKMLGNNLCIESGEEIFTKYIKSPSLKHNSLEIKAQDNEISEE